MTFPKVPKDTKTHFFIDIQCVLESNLTCSYLCIYSGQTHGATHCGDSFLIRKPIKAALNPLLKNKTKQNSVLAKF